MDFSLFSTDAINYPFYFFSNLSTIFCSYIHSKLLHLALFLTQCLSCYFDNIHIFSCSSSVLHLRVFLPRYLKLKFFTISLAHVQCILKWFIFYKWLSNKPKEYLVLRFTLLWMPVFPRVISLNEGDSHTWVKVWPLVIIM